MFRLLLLGCLLAAPGAAEDPFTPLDFNNPGTTSVLDQNSARQDWAKITNQRLQMAGKTQRVAVEAAGLTAVVFAPDVVKRRQAKPILLGKGDYAALFKSVVGLGFTRLVVRNPDSGETWGARLEKGKSILED